VPGSIQGAPSQGWHPQALLKPVKILALPVRYRLYPIPAQKQALTRQFGCCRVVWNDALAFSRGRYKARSGYPGASALQKLCITQAKRTEGRIWLAEVSASVLQQSVRDLDRAFRNWWKSKGKARAPHFKKWSNAQSARICGKKFRPSENGVRFAKVGELQLRWSRTLPSPSSSCTIIKDCAGRYFASFVVEVERPKFPATGRAVAMDLGLVALAVTGDGAKVAPPKLLRSAPKRLRRLQRNLKQKQGGSNRLALAKLRVAKLPAKVSDRRLDFLHKLGTRLIRENQAMCIEDLKVSGILKNRKLSKAIADAGWRTFKTFPECKAELYGRVLKVVCRWEPTSQVCSVCGQRDGRKPLRMRAWTCPACGPEHDRDVNAAKNILAAGLVERLNGRGAKKLTSLLASGCETSTHLNREVQKCPA